VDACVVNFAEPAIPEFHVNVFPFAIVATNTSPQLLKDQSPGSKVTVDALTAFPYPVQSEAL
jgi:hypothetical protein